MDFKYLHDKNWLNTTREERQFCAALFGLVRDKPQDFVRLLKKAKWYGDNTLPKLNNRTDWEVGFEVALGRDLCEESLSDLSKESLIDLGKYRNLI